jgi:DNA-directed RNA polymerase sigma subunit (sigma70/sigma32)
MENARRKKPGPVVAMLEAMHRVLVFCLNYRELHAGDATVDEVAAGVGMTVRAVEELVTAKGDGPGATTPVGHQSDEPVAVEDRLKARVAQLLRCMTYREREFLKLHYGLGFCEPPADYDPDPARYTFKELGQVFKRTPERMRQVHRKAIAKLERWFPENPS